MRTSTCHHCNGEIVRHGRGSMPHFCSEACRLAIAREKRLGRYVARPRRIAKVCGHEGCGRPIATLGYCPTHAARFRKHGTTELPEMHCIECGVGLGRYGYWRAKCPGCLHKSAKVTAESNRIRARENRVGTLARHRDRLARYRLTPEQFAARLAEQNNSCAICQAPIAGDAKSTHIDHSHQSGDVRGLLCPHCNKGLGYFHDDPARLLAAAAYLESGGVIVAT